MKVCRVCKEDCSSKARVRDPEGNYYCRSCFDEQKAAAEAAPVAAVAGAAFEASGEDPGLAVEDEGFGLADLMGDIGPAGEGSSMCPECGYAMRAGAALCVHCGYDPSKGKAIRTAVKAPERDPLESEYAAKRARAASAAAMTPVRMVVATAITGAVCAGVWMLVVYQFQTDRFLAVLTGSLIGVGAIKGARGDGGFLVGLTAAVVALITILGGRYGGVGMLVDDHLKVAQRNLEVNEEIVMVFLVREVADDWEEEGRELDWPLGVRPDPITDEEDCPPELWDAAQERWAQMSPSQQRNYTYQVEDMVTENMEMFASEAKGVVFAATITPRFMLGLFFGVVAAFATGMWGDDLPV
jgi:hypothetical protein